MTTLTHDNEQLARQLRDEATRTKVDAHDAIDHDNPALAIALLKTLRSLHWRATGLRIDLAEDAKETAEHDGNAACQRSP